MLVASHKLGQPPHVERISVFVFFAKQRKYILVRSWSSWWSCLPLFGSCREHESYEIGVIRFGAFMDGMIRDLASLVFVLHSRIRRAYAHVIVRVVFLFFSDNRKKNDASSSKPTPWILRAWYQSSNERHSSCNMQPFLTVLLRPSVQQQKLKHCSVVSFGTLNWICLFLATYLQGDISVACLAPRYPSHEVVQTMVGTRKLWNCRQILWFSLFLLQRALFHSV